MNFELKNLLEKHEITFFYLTAIAWTWGLWFLLDIMFKNPDLQTGVPIPLQIIENPFKFYLVIALFAAIFAVYGPAISAFIFASITHGKEGRRYWIRKIFYWRIGLKWYVLVLLMVVSIKYSIPIVVILFGAGDVSAIEALPISELIIVFVLNLIPSGGQEEVGWRYIQLRLQERFSFPVTALINGILNWVWHIPLYLFFSWNSLYQQPIWFFLLYEIPLQFIYCYLTNATKSALPAILMHALFNTLGHFSINLYPGIYPYLGYLVLTIVCYLIVLVLYLKNGKNLSSEPIMLFTPVERVTSTDTT